MDTKTCGKCKVIKTVSAFYLNRGRPDGLSGYCVECQREAETVSRVKRRQSLITDLGGCCVTCGFTDHRALQIDHVNSDGRIDRIKHPNTNSAKFYDAVRADPDRYALVCANCNWIKRHEANEMQGKRVYQRTEPQEKRQSEGRWSPEANARRSATNKEGWTDDRRTEWAEEVRVKATGRRMVTSEDGKRHWAYPGDPNYPDPVQPGASPMKG
jgi:hypothetical protein